MFETLRVVAGYFSCLSPTRYALYPPIVAESLNLQRSARTVGTVDAVEPDMIAITTPAGQSQHLWTSHETRVMTARVGRRKDVHTGARIFVKRHPERTNLALEVVVLPATSQYGTPIIAAAPDSVTFKDMFGNLVTVNTRKARIDTTAAGDLEDVYVGSTVFARVAVTDDGELAGAYEIIVLPEDTAFGS
jgi:hypothetical protein